MEIDLSPLQMALPALFGGLLDAGLSEMWVSQAAVISAVPRHASVWLSIQTNHFSSIRRVSSRQRMGAFLYEAVILHFQHKTNIFSTSS